MTVYFACQSSRPDLVKIGFSENVERRMKNMSSSFDGGIELLASCDGDRMMESGFHEMFRDHQVEGEWFRRNEALDRLIGVLNGQTAGVRRFERTKGMQSGSREQQQMAELMAEVVAVVSPANKIGVQLEELFQRLSTLNPMWSRRRVRSCWERRARRIEVYEVRDLISVLTDDAAKRRERAAVWIFPEAERGQ